jgi:hypothetical protein
MASTVAELEIAKLQTLTGLTTGNLTDLRRAYYPTVSGLSTPERYSIVDHIKAYYGLSVSSVGQSFTDMEIAYMRFVGATGTTYDDLAYNYWNTFGPSLPVISGLAAWYDANRITGLADGAAVSQWNDLSGNGRHLTQNTATNKPLYRSANPNLAPYSIAECVAGFYVGTANCAVAATTAPDGGAAIQATFSGAAVNNGTNRINFTVNGLTNVSFGQKFIISFDATLVSGTVGIIGTGSDSNGACATLASMPTVGVTQRVGATFDKVNANNSMFIYAEGGGTANAVWRIENIMVSLGGAGGGVLVASPPAYKPPVSLPFGKPTVQFDGVNDYIFNNGPVLGSGDASIFVVACQEVSSFCIVVEHTQSQRVQFSAARLGGAFALSNGGANRGAGATNALALNSHHVISTTFSSVSPMTIDARSDLNNGATASASFTAGDTPFQNSDIHFSVGLADLSAIAAPLMGEVAEIIAYSRVLTATERSAVESYLRAKWGTP